MTTKERVQELGQIAAMILINSQDRKMSNAEAYLIASNIMMQEVLDTRLDEIGDVIVYQLVDAVSQVSTEIRDKYVGND